jgi:hypothetical protein
VPKGLLAPWQARVPRHGRGASPAEVQRMVQKIGMFILVTFALIALIKQPETVGAFIESIGNLLGQIAQAIADVFNSV